MALQTLYSASSFHLHIHKYKPQNDDNLPSISSSTDLDFLV